MAIFGKTLKLGYELRYQNDSSKLRVYDCMRKAGYELKQDPPCEGDQPIPNPKYEEQCYTPVNPLRQWLRNWLTQARLRT